MVRSFDDSNRVCISSALQQVACGYAVTFLIILGLQILALIYLLLLAKETEFEPVRPDEHTSLISTTGKQLVTVIREFYRVLTKPRPFRLILALNLLAFGVEMLIFSGLSDIQYSYLRYKLKFGDKKYGWFSGLSYGITTAAVLFLYPLLRMKWMSDGMLATVGLFFKMISLFMFAFVQNEIMAYSIAVVVMFNRFVSTGFRAFISSLIDMQEQGKIFSVISLLEGITTLIATSIYNNLYPKTLSFFPGLLYLISAALLLIPLFIVSTSDFMVRKRRPEVSEGILNSRNDVIDEASDSY
uniref:Solute carrier family 46 member 3 n=1 Tax=Caenorhabditis tropicalis TaxID=1561998 RepID=A0A1I7UZL9_9PELO